VKTAKFGRIETNGSEILVRLESVKGLKITKIRAIPNDNKTVAQGT